MVVFGGVSQIPLTFFLKGKFSLRENDDTQGATAKLFPFPFRKRARGICEGL